MSKDKLNKTRQRAKSVRISPDGTVSLPKSLSCKLSASKEADVGAVGVADPSDVVLGGSQICDGEAWGLRVYDLTRERERERERAERK